MKVVSDVDLRLVSPDGGSGVVILKANEPRELGDTFALLALSKGANIAPEDLADAATEEEEEAEIVEENSDEEEHTGESGTSDDDPAEEETEEEAEEEAEEETEEEVEGEAEAPADKAALPEFLRDLDDTTLNLVYIYHELLVEADPDNFTSAGMVKSVKLNALAGEPVPTERKQAIHDLALKL